jgi:hypothetical protein
MAAVAVKNGFVSRSPCISALKRSLLDALHFSGMRNVQTQRGSCSWTKAVKEPKAPGAWSSETMVGRYFAFQPIHVLLSFPVSPL